jgi:hypothetical protein
MVREVNLKLLISSPSRYSQIELMVSVGSLLSKPAPGKEGACAACTCVA